MFNVAKYRSPVSLIPLGCPQFLDFVCPPDALPKVRRTFQEEVVAGNEATRAGRVLHCLMGEDDGEPLDMRTGKPLIAFGNHKTGTYMETYQLDSNKCLAMWEDVWIPVPFLRQRDHKWPDGKEHFECGPSNWSRARLHRDADGTVRLTLIFDMQVEPLPTPLPSAQPPATPLEIYHALSPSDIEAHAAFRMATHVRDNSWYLNAGWVDEWLFGHFETRRKGEQSEEKLLEYLASYLTIVEFMAGLTGNIVVQVRNPNKDTPVEVDLVLDIGNSRTSGILIETQTQRATNLKDGYLLQLRDLTRPHTAYTDPFETRVEFSEASFGNDRLSLRSGRRTPAFVWPSSVRVGPEAVRLSTLAVCADGLTGLSSPKRYLWDERKWQQGWRCNKEGAPEPHATHGRLSECINSQGTPLLCMNDAGFEKVLSLRDQKRNDNAPAFEANYSRSSTMLFMLVEILLQALTTINSPGQRSERATPDVPRRLRRVIFTVPPGMPLAEQRIYRRWVLWAIRVLWDCLGWSDHYIPPTRDTQMGIRRDFRSSPSVQCNWDEATCTQLVYLYNELTTRLQGDAHHLFAILGRKRPEHNNLPCIRMATIDIGGGTTDLSVTTYVLTSPDTDSARITPHSDFRDGFNLAGDDILHDVIRDHVFPAIDAAAAKAGATTSVTSQAFGWEQMGISEEQRHARTHFIRQVAVPVALGLLHVYEHSDSLTGDSSFTVTFNDFFTNANPQIPAAPSPSAKALAYVEEAVSRRTGTPFNLLEAPIPVNPRAVDLTVDKALSRPLSDLCEVVQCFDCDVLLLTGRPSRWNGIIAPVLNKLSVPPHRVVPMSRYHVGNWYPFADALGRITDPKTTVVAGAILCALAEGQLQSFSFDTASLRLKSTARHIGEVDESGRLWDSKVWFRDVDVDSTKEPLREHKVQFSAPISVGFRQVGVERWPTTRFYMINFSSEDARRASVRKTPYTLTLKLEIPEQDPDKIIDLDEGGLIIEEVVDAAGETVPKSHVCAQLQTLPMDEGYWLDTGMIKALDLTHTPA